ncbi:hypothetical protein [Azorhizophilus paspali]|uniref:TubC N-terminal docking domain-containing protein n=1 Tax=Azorhizophilus paspali TaxID=69963 RepID=A0ABV6SHB7_AZOPA
MAALDYLHQAGLTVELDGDRLRVMPADRITEELRQYLRDRRSELLAELKSADDSQRVQSAPCCWLHLLVFNDGNVIQHCSEAGTSSVKQTVQLRYGDAVLAVVPVPGFKLDEEIIKGLAGTLGVTAPLPPPSLSWLFQVARLLGVQPAVLLDNGHLEQHDLSELAGANPHQVAETIRNSPAWINRLERQAVASSSSMADLSSPRPLQRQYAQHVNSFAALFGAI